MKKGGGACCFLQGLQIVIFVSLMIFRTERQLINPFKYRIISHLHGGVILLLRPQSSSFFYIFKCSNPVGLSNKSPKSKTMKDSGRGSKMTSSCKWRIRA